MNEASESELRHVRGDEIAIIFQDAQSALMPTMSVGHQIAELFREHRDMSQDEAELAAVDVLRKVLPDPVQVERSYPFQLSGGMAQRALIAMAMALDPAVVIADEPTSSLDASVRQEMLGWLEQMRDDRDVAVLLITHDLGVVARFADRVAVMYAGEIVESADVRTIFREPKHPYTFDLLQSVPTLTGERGRRLTVMKGRPPDLSNLPPQCPFLPRCNKATSRCRTDDAPVLTATDEGGLVACYNPIVVPVAE
jgi:oligopeptide/dipeptide ABC transporter ATP-binding protein